MEFAKAIERKRPTIPRSNEPPRLSGFHFESWEVLQRQLSVAQLGECCLFSDLLLGAWKGHWVVHELCLQLGIDIYENAQPMINMKQEGDDYTGIINRLIDNESSGDQNFLIAYESCKKIIAEILNKKIEWVLIIPPMQGYSWEAENRVFVHLLYEGLKATSCKLGLLTYSGADIPEEWQVDHAFPQGSPVTSTGSFPVAGVLDPGLVPLFQNWIPTSSLRISGGHLVIAPSSRGNGTDNPAFFAQKLKGIDNANHLRVIFELQQLNGNSDVAFLQWEASRRFSEGGYAIALRILEACRSKICNAVKVAAVVSQIQNIRIALMQFAEAAGETLPEGNLPDDYKASLYQSKAWGLVMINRAHEAEPFFELARTYLSEAKFPRAYLYLLNISALNKLKTGDLEKAFEFEKEIEDKLSNQKVVDWHILYINSINLARLYKKIRNYELAQSYYLKAFEVNTCLKEESDLLYANFCFAQLEELKENHKTAFIFWVRTCVHWLSNEVPEALAPRVAQAILGQALSGRASSVEAISGKLKWALLTICQKINLPIENWEKGEFPAFARIERAEENPDIALGVVGLGVLASTKREKSTYRGPEYQSLQQLTYRVLCLLLPGLSDYRSIYTDSQFGNELPVTAQELIASCIRHKVTKVVFKEKKYSLSEPEKKKLLLASKLRICKAIGSISHSKGTIRVYYKRYKPPLLIADHEKWVLENLHLHSDIASIYAARNNDESTFPILRKMEEKRLISIYL